MWSSWVEGLVTAEYRRQINLAASEANTLRKQLLAKTRTRVPEDGNWNMLDAPNPFGKCQPPLGYDTKASCADDLTALAQYLEPLRSVIDSSGREVGTEGE